MTGDKIIIDRAQFLVLLTRVESMLEEVRSLKATLKRA